MASTVKASTLTVTIKEDIDLNGQPYGSVSTLKLANINEVSSRIMNVGTASTNVLAFGDANGAGTYHNTDVKYIRITNLDDTNYGVIRLTGAGGIDQAVRLDAGGSWVFAATTKAGDPLVNIGVDDFGDNGGVALDKLTGIAMTSNTQLPPASNLTA